MSRNEGRVLKRAGFYHEGTEAFAKRVIKNRKNKKAARKARRKSR